MAIFDGQFLKITPNFTKHCIYSMNMMSFFLAGCKFVVCARGWGRGMFHSGNIKLNLLCSGVYSSTFIAASVGCQKDDVLKKVDDITSGT